MVLEKTKNTTTFFKMGLTVFIHFCFSTQSYSQYQKDTIYCDMNFNQCSRDVAVYYAFDTKLKADNTFNKIIYNKEGFLKYSIGYLNTNQTSVYHGKYVSYFDNGAVANTVTYNQGKETGVGFWYYPHPAGCLKKMYDYDKQIVVEYYANGKILGEYKFYKNYYRDSLYVLNESNTYVKYFANGKKSKQRNYLFNQYGFQLFEITWNFKNKIFSKVFVDYQKLIIKTVEYFTDNNKIKKEKIENIREGQFSEKEYYENGQLKSVSNYGNAIGGNITHYHPNGNLDYKHNYNQKQTPDRQYKYWNGKLQTYESRSKILEGNDSAIYYFNNGKISHIAIVNKQTAFVKIEQFETINGIHRQTYFIEQYGENTPIAKQFRYNGNDIIESNLIFKQGKKIKIRNDVDNCLWGVMRNNVWIVKPVYELIEPENVAGQFIARKNNLYGVIDSLGNEIIPFQYDEIKIINNVDYGYYPFKSYTLRIDILNDLHIPTLIDQESSYQVTNKEKSAIFNTKGKPLSSFVFDEIGVLNPFNYSMRYYYYYRIKQSNDSLCSYGIINEDGSASSPLSIKKPKLINLKKSLFLIQNKEGRYGMCNQYGEVVIPCNYSDYKEPGYDFIVFSNNIEELCYYAEKDTIIKGNFSNISNNIVNDYAILSMDNGFFLFNNLRNINFWFSGFSAVGNDFSFNDYIIVKNKFSNKYGIIDVLGNWVLEAKYDSIVKSYSTPGGYDLNTKTINEFFIVKKGKKLGVANNLGKIEIPIQYDYIQERQINNDKSYLLVRSKIVTEANLKETGIEISPFEPQNEDHYFDIITNHNFVNETTNDVGNTIIIINNKVESFYTNSYVSAVGKSNILITTENKSYLYNKYGKIILRSSDSMTFLNPINPFSIPLANKAGKVGLMDENGTLFLSVSWDAISDIDTVNKLIWVVKGYKPEPEILLTYNESDTLWGMVYKEYFEGNWQLYNYDKKNLYNTKHKTPGQFSENIIIVNPIDSLGVGVLNQDGSYLIQPIYQNIYIHGNVLLLEKDALFYLFNNKGESICQYPVLHLSEENSILCVYTTNGPYLYNQKGDILFASHPDSLLSVNYDNALETYTQNTATDYQNYLLNKGNIIENYQVIDSFSKFITHKLRRNIESTLLSYLQEIEYPHIEYNTQNSYPAIYYYPNSVFKKEEEDDEFYFYEYENITSEITPRVLTIDEEYFSSLLTNTVCEPAGRRYYCNSNLEFRNYRIKGDSIEQFEWESMVANKEAFSYFVGLYVKKYLFQQGINPEECSNETGYYYDLVSSFCSITKEGFVFYYIEENFSYGHWYDMEDSIPIKIPFEKVKVYLN